MHESNDKDFPDDALLYMLFLSLTKVLIPEMIIVKGNIIEYTFEILLNETQKRYKITQILLTTGCVFKSA